MLEILRNNKWIVLITILASILRFSYLSQMPPSLNWDEVSHGYNAYSILKTGKDEWGISFPTIFRSFGDYKLPGYIYLTAISELFFGLNELGVRLPSALAGVGVVFFTYLLALNLFKNKRVSSISAFLVAVEPWSLFLSRGAFEANLALFFVLSGTYFFLSGIGNKDHPIYLPLSSILLGASVWTYNSARVFIPIYVIFLAIIFMRQIKARFSGKKINSFISLSILLAFLVPMFAQLLQPVGQARYNKVAIINEGAVARIEQTRNNPNLPKNINRLLNNKATYFIKTFTKNWVSHFSPDFLFFTGGKDYQFSVPDNGILYWSDIIPLTTGLIFLIKKKSKTSSLLIIWLALAPIPSALTNEAPHVLRSILVLPIPMIISALGIFEISNYIERKLKIKAALIIFIYLVTTYLFFENFAFNYATNYATNYSWSWQYGYKQAVSYVKSRYNDFDNIIITKKYGEPHEFFLFYLSWDPQKYINDPNLIRFAQSDWFWVDRFDKFWFVNDWQIPSSQTLPSQNSNIFVTESKHEINCQNKSCLLITSPNNSPKNWQLLKTINFLDGKPAFEIYSNQNILTYE